MHYDRSLNVYKCTHNTISVLLFFFRQDDVLLKLFKDRMVKVIDTSRRDPSTLSSMRPFYPRKVVFSNRSIETTTDCSLDISYYPFDSHTCVIQIVSEQDTEEEVSLNVSSFSEWVVSESKEWQIEELQCSVSKLSDSNDDKYSAGVIALKLRRMPLYYVMNILVPTGLLSLLLPMQFIMPLNSGERVSMGMSILIASNVFQLLVAQNVPRSSSASPVLSKY